MDWEAPVDAWYVWVGVSVISLAMAGFVLALPTGPPPDADGSANAIDRVSSSQYAASGTYDHDADEVKIDGATIAMRNDHGTDRATLRYGTVVPVWENARLAELARGSDFEAVYDDGGTADSRDAVETLVADADEAYRTDADEWRRADGELDVRTITVDAYWFEQWSTADAVRDEISAEADADVGSADSELFAFHYEVTERTEITFEVLDEEWYPIVNDTHSVIGEGVVAYDMEEDGIDLPVRTNVDYEERLDVETSTRLSERGVEKSHVSRVETPSPATVAADLEWLEYDDESDAYRFTVVTA